MKIKIGCSAFIILFIINITIGTWSIIEILSWFGKSIPLWSSILLGLFTGEFSIPIAIIGKILKICGVF
ncbi:hypothetical protein [Clostridium botulinum]|uniref:hypothetical protein n=1 Tax=Clostridium botulinum TaxID=1491 RepID=UPI00174BFAE5|nr:hypothetical protein [Clostridium botulinum]MBD5589275.1 hypothetical protein [Clostridium botulinum]